jgi:hypothetical protein
MSSSLFNDLPLSADQLASDYRLSKLNQAGLQLDALGPQVVTLEGRVDTIEGTDLNNNILVGDAITNVPDVANMVIIGDGDKSNAKAKDILLGDGVVCDGGDTAGTLHVGQGMEAVGGGVTAVGAGSSTASIRIYYNGDQYYLPLFAARA